LNLRKQTGESRARAKAIAPKTVGAEVIRVRAVFVARQGMAHGRDIIGIGGRCAANFERRIGHDERTIESDALVLARRGSCRFQNATAIAP
jgi:hypothetical protein